MGVSSTGTFSGTFIESRLVVLPEFLTFYFPELLVNSAKKVVFSVWLVGWFACKQGCAKPTDPSSMKLGGMVYHGPRKNSLHFGVDQSRW